MRAHPLRTLLLIWIPLKCTAEMKDSNAAIILLQTLTAMRFSLLSSGPSARMGHVEH